MDDGTMQILEAISGLSTKIDGLEANVQRFKDETISELSEIVRATGSYIDESSARNTTQILAVMENTIGKRLDSLSEEVQAQREGLRDYGERLSAVESMPKPAI